MKKRPIILTIAGITIGILLSSCVDPAVKQGAQFTNIHLQGSGSPFRVRPGPDGQGVEYHLISTPLVASEAEGQLKQDVLAGIGKFEVTKGGQMDPRLIETRSVASKGKGVREIWLVDRNGQTVAYVITFKPNPQGGTDFRLQGGIPVVE